MSESTTLPVPLTAERSPWLRGSIRIPGERGLSHLALILAAMARGESVIENLAGGPETATTIRVLGQMGVPIAKRAGRWHVQGLGVGGLLTPDGPFDLSAAGTGAPYLIGLLAAHDFDSRLIGVGDAPAVVSILEFFRRNGARVESEGNETLLRGPRFAVPLDLGLSAAAGSMVAPLLLHSLLITGASTLHLPRDLSDPAIGVLINFGARLTTETSGDGRAVRIEGMMPLRAQAFGVPGDPALAAYPAVAALIAPDSEIRIEALARDGRQLAILDALQLLGGDIHTELRPGRDLVDLAVRHSHLVGTTIPADLPIMAEDFAVLSIAAAFAEGETVFEGLGEGNRRLMLTRALRSNGIECEERSGGLMVRGMARVPGGGNIVTRLDPKLAMGFLVLGMATDKPVQIDDGAVMTETFPEFVSAFEHIGASFTVGATA